MSPALNGSSAIRRFKHSNAVEIRDRITFNLGLPQFFAVSIARWQNKCLSLSFIQKNSLTHTVAHAKGNTVMETGGEEAIVIRMRSSLSIVGFFHLSQQSSCLAVSKYANVFCITQNVSSLLIRSSEMISQDDHSSVEWLVTLSYYQYTVGKHLAHMKEPLWTQQFRIHMAY